MDHNKIEGNEQSVFTRLMHYAKPFAGQMVLASIMMLGTTVLELYAPTLLGNAIDSFAYGTDFDAVKKLGLTYLAALVCMFALYVGQMWLLGKTGQSIIYNVRNELFAHIEGLHLGFFDVTPVGKLVTRVTNDVEALSDMFSGILVRLLKNAVKIIGLSVVMLLLNARLALRAFALVPVIVVLTFLFKRISRTCYRITRAKLTAINTYLSEHISGMKLIRIFNREYEKNLEFRERSEDLFKAYFREIMVYAVFRPCIYLLSIIALINIIWGGSGLVFAENALAGSGITVGVLYIFIQYVSSFFEPIQDLAEQIGTLQQAFASAEKIFSVLDEKPAIVNNSKAAEEGTSVSNILGRIEFDHVWFAYNGEDWILKDVSFVIEPGEKVAFVGATGAGKTTILSLVGRYYEISKGRILIDGTDIREMDTDVLRRAIGQVQQDVFIFTGDIAGNIRLGNENISDDDIVRAAHTANADRFIEKLEHKYDEPVSERGSTLSAGERQLLSFARTLAYDPKILVMDEATANIDTETESLITEALERLMSGRTTIMVAHRLSTIQHADCIMVMHKGRLVERGTHQELLAANGIYKKLYELQRA
ncbi:MAG: ABC transporter ATP-binding protein/permease [Lachnospiraceae bacterium]|nr:ABC transporter ATP-binding protein/permease [Lachnospiraceae bacterium]